MKILFVATGRAGFTVKNKTLINELTLKFFPKRRPLTFPILAALTSKKHTVSLIEGPIDNINYDKEWDVVGISCTTPYAYTAYEIADEFRKRGRFVVLGGWHPSTMPNEAKEHADSVVIGEAEETWPQLLDDFEKRKTKSFYFQERPAEPSLIPHPQSDIYPKGTTLGGVQATRGCPYGCEFCIDTNREYIRKFRMRPVENVIKDIRMIPSKIFFFYDNSLTINPEYSKELFKNMKDMNKKFGAFANIDLLSKDDEFLKLASEAGCISLTIGFESICQESLKESGKKTNLVNQYMAAIKKIHDYNITITGTFVFGFDHDTLDIFDRTDEFINVSEIDAPVDHILTPYPGTPLFNRLEREGRILTKDWTKYTTRDVVFQPKNMTPKELLDNTIKLRRRWYKTYNILRRSMMSLRFGYYPFFYRATANINYVARD